MPQVDDWHSAFFLERMKAALVINRNDSTRTFDSVVKEIFGPHTIELIVEKDDRIKNNTWFVKIRGDCNILGDDPDRVAGLLGMCNEDIQARKIAFDTKKREFVFLCTTT